MTHTNTAHCDGCEKILRRYPRIDPIVLRWVYQSRIVEPQLHVSCAGRGRADQEAAFKAHATRAHYLQSAHNYNMAVDVFRLMPNGRADFSETFYRTVVANLAKEMADLEWAGDWVTFPELDHVERKSWRALVTLYPEEYVPVDGPARSAT